MPVILEGASRTKNPTGLQKLLSIIYFWVFPRYYIVSKEPQKCSSIKYWSCQPQRHIFAMQRLPDTNSHSSGSSLWYPNKHSSSWWELLDANPTKHLQTCRTFTSISSNCTLERNISAKLHNDKSVTDWKKPTYVCDYILTSGQKIGSWGKS